MITNLIYLIHVYKPGLSLNNLQRLICHKIRNKPNQFTEYKYTAPSYMVSSILILIVFLQLYCLKYIFLFNDSHLLAHSWPNGLMGKVFADDPGDRGSIPGRVIPKTLKLVLDTSLLNTQQYTVRIKGKLEQSRERSSALLYTPSGRPRLRSPTLLFTFNCV